MSEPKDVEPKVVEAEEPAQAIPTTQAVQSEVIDYQDRYLRLAAEFENFKKRTERDRLQSLKYANENLLRDLLPVLDHLEHAVLAAESVLVQETHGGVKGVIVGVKMVLKQFRDTLEKYGVQGFTAMGQPFDPSKHEAVQEKEDDSVPDRTVIEEFQMGYMLNDRLVRPARVVVSKMPVKPTVE